MMTAAAFLLIYTLDGAEYASRYDVLASCVRDARHYTNGRCEREGVNVPRGAYLVSGHAYVAPKSKAR